MNLQQLIKSLRNLKKKKNLFFLFFCCFTYFVVDFNISADVPLKFRVNGELAVDVTGHCKNLQNKRTIIFFV